MSKLERITVTMPAEMAARLRAAVERGEYATTSEVVREALRDWGATGDHSPLMNNYGSPPRVFVKGDGAELWDRDGTRHLDFLCGLAVTAPVSLCGLCRQGCPDCLHSVGATL